jgi:O-antigen/teichoic acid export membrane protein
MRFAIGLVPFASLVAGAAPEIVRIVFGRQFMSAAPPLMLLIFAAVALLMISVASAILIAVDKPGWTAALAVFLVPLALAGCFLFIPAWGPRGAALATTIAAAAGALASMLAVKSFVGIAPPPATVLRSVLLSPLAYMAAAAWSAPGLLLVIKLPALSALICVMYFVLGEFSAAEMNQFRSLADWRSASRRSGLHAK